MKLRFWGTRGSIAKAGPTTVRYGGNTSCVELRTAGGTLAVIDCGTGAHGLGHALLDEYPEGPIDGHILITHTHWDHIQGFPFFAPLFREGSTWHVYGPRGFGTSLAETLSGQMQYTYFPVNLDEMDAEVHYHDLVEGEFRAGDLRVTAHYLNHPALTLGYRIEADDAVVVYASDHEPHARALAGGGAPGDSREDAAHVAFLAGADLLIHDAQYRASEYPEKAGWGHSTVEYAVDCAIAAGARALSLHHHDPLRDDAGVEENVALARERAAAAGSTLAVSAATEGAAIELARDTPRNARATPVRRDARMAPGTAHGGQGILIAGCEPAIAAALREAAQADGLQVSAVDSLEEALREAARSQPRVIFAGGALEGGGAEALCEGVRALPAPYGAEAVLIVTAGEHGAAHLPDEARIGANGRLTGPVTAQYVRSRLRAWLLRQACRWQAAPLPADEEERLAAVAGTGLLDTAGEERFDRITRLAASVFEVPVAIVSLVDADRQWFKSHFGTELTETPRDRAFCAHAILGDDVLVVPDAREDERFADNPMVVGEPRIRFYAGAPLKAADGRRVGTLCLIDYLPRTLSASERQRLLDLAHLVQVEFARGAPAG